MKDVYRGFDLDAHREKSLGGDVLLYYSAFKQSCGWELTSGFSDDEDTVSTHIGSLRKLVDEYYNDPNAYEHPLTCGRDKSNVEVTP